ncbi:hypothetical protein GCM10022222_59440 [Amycolatopsis ultiminotia]|uniref:Uncharacterized protein n=1 Tax=Amycolatopsis ultiminotia TaxID=543629 RepID=A0ABP6XIF8_9PSEU
MPCPPANRAEKPGLPAGGGTSSPGRGREGPGAARDPGSGLRDVRRRGHPGRQPVSRKTSPAGEVRSGVRCCAAGVSLPGGIAEMDMGRSYLLQITIDRIR